MKKKSKKRGVERMRDLGYKPVTTFLKRGAIHALEEFTEDEGVSRSEYIAGLVVEDLVKRGYLGRRLATQARVPKSGRKKASKGKRR